MEQKRFPQFSERFAQLRGRKSQDEFAKFLGIARPTVGFYENGTRVPDALVLRKIAERCGVSVDWLLGLSDEKDLNGDLAQVCRYVGLSKNAIQTLVSLKESPLGYKSVVADYILSYDAFFQEIIEYLSSCVWGLVEDDRTMEIRYSRANLGELKRQLKENGIEGAETVAKMFKSSFSLPCPTEEFEESISFAMIIKDLPRLYDSFKATRSEDKEFIEAVVQEHIRVMQPKE